MNKNYWNNITKNELSIRTVGNLRFSLHWNKYEYKLRQKMIEKITKHVDLINKSVLDVGCGSGFWINYFSKFTNDITGIDISSNIIKRHKEKFSDRFVFKQVDITRDDLLKVLKKKFYFINIIDVLFHIVNDNDYKKAINNISQIIKDDGFVLTTDMPIYRKDKSCSHVRYRKENFIMKTFSDNGFKLIDSRAIFFAMGGRDYLVPKKIIDMFDIILAPLYYSHERLIQKLFPKTKKGSSTYLFLWKYEHHNS
jgi:2-polyprenyl-3-methyl-5-hydroxy-6-metoxy-1,4-benzoquinol methylase